MFLLQGPRRRPRRDQKPGCASWPVCERGMRLMGIFGRRLSVRFCSALLCFPSILLGFTYCAPVCPLCRHPALSAATTSQSQLRRLSDVKRHNRGGWFLPLWTRDRAMFVKKTEYNSIHLVVSRERENETQGNQWPIRSLRAFFVFLFFLLPPFFYTAA